MPGRVLTTVALLACVTGCGAGASAPTALPIAVTKPQGGEVTLRAGHADPADDVKASWCLQTDYDGEITLLDERGRRTPTGGSASCGPSPAPEVSGLVSVDCDTPLIVVFGGARDGAGDVELASRSGHVTTARRAALPPRSGFSGSSFLLVAPITDLPATLRTSAGRRLVAIPARSRVCHELPGSGKAGTPTLSFP